MRYNIFSWIRAVSFVSLRETIFSLAKLHQGLRAKEINDIVQNSTTITTSKGTKPSITTIYHYRNTLLNLGVLTRKDHLYYLNLEDPLVASLCESLKPGTRELSIEERYNWSQLVFRNVDCREKFFNLFMASKVYSFRDFMDHGGLVAWKSIENDLGRLIRIYNLNNEGNVSFLRTEDEIQSVLYGVRYWARNEIKIIDELFLEDLGGVMYPIFLMDEDGEDKIASVLLNELRNTNSLWLTFSVRDLLFKSGPKLRLPIDSIHRIILNLHKKYSEFIVLIPTSASFATITASSQVVEKYQLRNYLQDEQGRYISHIRVHRKILEVYHGS